MSEHDKTGSAVILKIKGTGGQWVLCIGERRSPTRFAKNMDTLFVQYIADILAKGHEPVEHLMDTYQPLLDEFLNHLQHSKRYSPHTLKAYQRDLARFLAHLTIPCTHASVKVQNFVNSLHRKQAHN